MEYCVVNNLPYSVYIHESNILFVISGGFILVLASKDNYLFPHCLLFLLYASCNRNITSLL